MKLNDKCITATKRKHRFILRLKNQMNETVLIFEKTNFGKSYPTSGCLPLCYLLLLIKGVRLWLR